MYVSSGKNVQGIVICVGSIVKIVDYKFFSQKELYFTRITGVCEDMWWKYYDPSIGLFALKKISNLVLSIYLERL